MSTQVSQTNPPPQQTRAARVRRACIVGGIALAGVVVAATGHLEGAAGAFVPRCPTNAWFGLYCPACGATRALMRVFHGDLIGALHNNPAVVLAAPFAIYFFIMGTDLGARKWPRWQVAALIAIVLAYTILRNLPFWPWTLMAPPK